MAKTDILAQRQQLMTEDEFIDVTPQRKSSSSSNTPPGLILVLASHPFLSVLLVFVPFGIASFWLQWSRPVIFALNFFSILPMAWLIGKTTEDLATHTSQTVGGLLNATFGNIVEMLLCIAGIRHNEISVVQCTLVGSIISNLLLVLGTSFIYGGYNREHQLFSQAGASAQCSLLLLAVLSLMLPTLYAIIMSNTDRAVIEVSRWSSILMLITYFQYLIFQLKTHKHLFEGEDDEDKEEADLSAKTSFVTLGVCFDGSVLRVLNPIHHTYGGGMGYFQGVHWYYYPADYRQRGRALYGYNSCRPQSNGSESERGGGEQLSNGIARDTFYRLGWVGNGPGDDVRLPPIPGCGAVDHRSDRELHSCRRTIQLA
eukprot:GEMP01025438.1.p1 GENE.GEMP01025438.1~~GEMP01025438.1.p1  ORF type:complete len:371 (+),score=33.35 GEMP01025438.1:174-1286(+)